MNPFRRPWLALYVLCGLGLSGVYALAELSGIARPSPSVHAVITRPSVRAPPGSSGSSGGFWHSGSHGGK